MCFISTSLTARLKACLFLTLRGNGANGKSYLMELVRGLLGGVFENGYGYKMPIQFLTENDRTSNQATPALMPLEYARMTYFSESDKSEKLRVAKKKMLTSQEPLNGRANYGNTKNFMHASNFILTTNYALIIDTTDHGTWRRERYYTMKMKFCKEPNPEHKYERKADPSFAGKKARDPDFLSGFLSILTVYFGIVEMQYGGDIELVPCPTIFDETEKFRNSQDVMNRFITERAVYTVDVDNEIPLSDIVDEYCRWYDNTIKQQTHDRYDISLMFQNSRIGKKIKKGAARALVVKGCRILGAGEEKLDAEKYIVNADEESKRSENGECIFTKYDPKESYEQVVQKVYGHYLKLLEKNNVQYWNN
jgi:phage/plasmid-associated DNA primase